MDEFIVADTTVLSYLSKHSEHADAYNALIGLRRLAVSFQTPPELNGGDLGEKRLARINELLAATLVLPCTEATGIWYSRIVSKRNELKKGGGFNASDADVWIVSSAMEHGLPLISADSSQVTLGRAVGLAVFTNLPGLREDNPDP